MRGLLPCKLGLSLLSLLSLSLMIGDRVTNQREQFRVEMTMRAIN